MSAVVSSFTEDALLKLIRQSPTKSCLLDPAPTWLLKDSSVTEAVLPTLTSAINSSLQSGVVPAHLKAALISPLIKKADADPEDLASYRPVSNLPFIGKLMERVVARQLTQYLQENGLNDPFQSAYRAEHSTESALLRIKNDIDVALDGGDGVLLVLLDLSAAFDTIYHTILLDRLEHCCGITGVALQWMRSYLSDRTQSVLIGDARSDIEDLNIGVPQGSVLGPLLFLVYLLPLLAIMRRHGICYHGYADDTQIYHRFSVKKPGDLQDAIRRLEACLEEICSWMVLNKLKLNGLKTEFIVMISAYHQALVDSMQPVLKIGDSIITPTKTVRNLGVTLDREMTMGPYIRQITRSAYFRLQKISTIRCNLNQETCAAAVRALVLSKLDYANTLLIGLPEKLVGRLQIVQNDAARLVSRTSRRDRDHITPVLRQMHWLPVRHRITHKLLTLTYRALHSESAPLYLRDLLQPHQPPRVLRSGDAPPRLVRPRTKKLVGERAFVAAAPTHWNNLPDSVRGAQSLTVFKKHVKTLLFRQHYGD